MIEFNDLSSVLGCFFDFAFTEALCQEVVGLWQFDAVHGCVGNEIADGPGHFVAVERRRGAIVGNTVSFAVCGFDEKDVATRIFFEVNLLGFDGGASVAVGEVCEYEVEICVLSIGTGRSEPFEFDVVAPFFLRIDVIESGKIVARIRESVTCHII